MKKISTGFAQIHFEEGEVHDFLPSIVADIARQGADVYREHGYGHA